MPYALALPSHYGYKSVVQPDDNVIAQITSDLLPCIFSHNDHSDNFNSTNYRIIPYYSLLIMDACIKFIALAVLLFPLGYGQYERTSPSVHLNN